MNEEQRQDWLHSQEQSILDEPAQDIMCSYDGCGKFADTTDASGEVVCSYHLMSE